MLRFEVFVNGESQGTVTADVKTGSFVLPGILLEAGENTLTARAVDPMGNNSELSVPVIVQVVANQPTAVTSLTFKSHDFSADYTGDVAIGETLYIELTGTDADTQTIDAAMVTLKSSVTDPAGIVVQLLETAPDSGLYRGTATVGDTSKTATGTIGVSAGQVETITVTSEINPDIYDAVRTVDSIPPPAPTIMSSTHPSLTQDTFEFDTGQWANRSHSYGAALTRTPAEASTGMYAVQMVNTEAGGDFANYVRSQSFDARQYPLISFDYKMPEGIKLNLVAYVNGMWKEIVFTDDPKTVETFDEDLYRSIGVIEGTVADNTWRHAALNLYNLLKNDDPHQASYLVEELFFADYNLPGWMEFIMGSENPDGATWYVNNFIISEGGKSTNRPTSTWIPNDASVVEYSYVLDQQPDTVPDAVSEGPETTVAYDQIADGTWYFHVRSLDGGGNWGPANHYRIKIDVNVPIADSPDPANESSSGSLEVKVRITDGSGSGVDPDAIQLQINGAIYDMASGGLEYDENSGVLTFSLWKVTPAVDPWLDGEVVQAGIVAEIQRKGFKKAKALGPYNYLIREMNSSPMKFLKLSFNHRRKRERAKARIKAINEMIKKIKALEGTNFIDLFMG